MNYLSLSLGKAAEVTLDAWQSNPRSAPFWMGPPGIGKTERAQSLASEIAQILGPTLIAQYGDPRKTTTELFPAFDLPCLEAAHGADEDIAGIPVRDAVSGAVQRLPIGPLRRASVAPSVLFFDEVSRASAQKQGCLLTITNEGRAGDFSLHPASRVLLAANGIDSSGTHTIIETLSSRCLMIEIVPSLDEFLAHLMTTGALSSTLRELAIDYAMTARKAPDLVAFYPPDGATESGLQWANPRAIVKGLKVFDQSLQNKRSGDVLFAGLAGHIGKESAGAYLTIRKIREKLPSVEEIEKTPKDAKVPGASDVDANIGLMGLVGIAASRNPDSAWLYTSRIASQESAIALTKMMGSFHPKDNEAKRARLMLMGKVGMALEA